MKDNAKLPTVHCDIIQDRTGFTIGISIGGMKDLDETSALVRSLAMPLATAITEFYKQPPPTKEEFLMGPGYGGTLH